MPTSTAVSLTGAAERKEVLRHGEGPATANKLEEEPRARRGKGSSRPRPRA
jgi:hypothetical protein